MRYKINCEKKESIFLIYELERDDIPRPIVFRAPLKIVLYCIGRLTMYLLFRDHIIPY